MEERRGNRRGNGKGNRGKQRREQGSHGSGEQRSRAGKACRGKARRESVGRQPDCDRQADQRPNGGVVSFASVTCVTVTTIVR